MNHSSNHPLRSPRPPRPRQDAPRPGVRPPDSRMGGTRPSGTPAPGQQNRAPRPTDPRYSTPQMRDGRHTSPHAPVSRPPQTSPRRPPAGNAPRPESQGMRPRPMPSRAPQKTVPRRQSGGAVRTVVVLFCLALAIVLGVHFALTYRASKTSVPPMDDRQTTPAASESSPETTPPPDTETEPVTHAPLGTLQPKPKALHTAIASDALVFTDEIDSTYAALVDRATGFVIAHKNGDATIYPASMTKIMTLLVGYESAASLDDTFTVTSTLIDPLYRQNASMAGFAPGETVTVRDLLYGTVLPSGAEAATALAIATAGSVEEFVSRMNEKAAELGLRVTHFENCTGLHDASHVSTCEEIAVILDYAMQYEACREILTTYRYTTTATEQHPEGVLLESTMFSRMYGNEAPGMTVLGGKTGYTLEAHQCLASVAERERDGAGYIFVTAGAEGKFEPVFDAIEVYTMVGEMTE